MPTYTYDVPMHPGAAPYPISTGVSQAIDATGVDRFTISLGYDFGSSVPVEGECVYQAKISLIYDAVDKATMSDTLVFSLSTLTIASIGECFGISTDACEANVERSKELLGEIRGVQAVRCPRIQALIEAHT